MAVLASLNLIYSYHKIHLYVGLQLYVEFYVLCLMSNNKYFSTMYILFRNVGLLFYSALSVYRACAQQRSLLLRKPCHLLTAKWIYLHDFLTFTDEKYTCDVSVMHWGKHNVSNALNSTNIFAVCHGGSIWCMTDIKGCLRISAYIKLSWFIEPGSN